MKEKNAYLRVAALALVAMSASANSYAQTSYGVMYQEQDHQSDASTLIAQPYTFQAFLNGFSGSITGNVSTPGGTGSIPTLTSSSPFFISGDFSDLSSLESAYAPGNYVFSSNADGTTSSLALNTSGGFATAGTISSSDPSVWVGPGLKITSNGTIDLSFTTPDAIEYAVFSIEGTSAGTTSINQTLSFGSPGSPLAAGTTENFSVSGLVLGIYQGSLSFFTSGGDLITTDFGGQSTPFGASSLQTTTNMTLTVVAAPEPSTWALMTAGLLLLVVGMRYRTARTVR